MFSQSVEYALRAMVFLAQHPQAPQKTKDISAATKVPGAYLTKILQQLQRSGLVDCQRGVGGGVRMARDADRVTILEVVEAVDPIPRIKTCPLELKSHGKRLCSLHRRMDRALEAMEQAFASTTLRGLLEENNPSQALCESKPRRDAVRVTP